jgi:hypothetical protein
MSSQYVTTTVIYESNGVSYSTTMEEAQFTSKGPYSFERWYQCQICAHDFPKSQVVLRGDAAFCIPHTCYLDADDRR